MTTKQKYREDTLIAEFKSGSQQAFRRIYDLFYVPILYFTRRLTLDEEADDIAAETFIKLFKLHENFDSLPNIRAFLYITARNACLNYIKYESRRATIRKEYAYLTSKIEDEASVYENKEEDELKAAFLRHLYDLIEKLPSQCKMVFKMAYLEHLKNPEIAERTNLSINTVTNHKVRALELLRGYLKNEGLLLGLITLQVSLQCFAKDLFPHI